MCVTFCFVLAWIYYKMASGKACNCILISKQMFGKVLIQIMSKTNHSILPCGTPTMQPCYFDCVFPMCAACFLFDKDQVLVFRNLNVLGKVVHVYIDGMILTKSKLSLLERDSAIIVLLF